MKPIAHLGLIMMLFLFSCQNRSSYTNETLRAYKHRIDFYRPAGYHLVHIDTLIASICPRFMLTYTKNRDSSLIFKIAIDVRNPQKQNDKKILDTLFRLKMEALSQMVDTEYKYGYLLAQYGRKYARMHNVIKDMDYMIDEMSTVVDGNSISFFIQAKGYFNDTSKYSMIRDSLFNSIHIN